jgi:hypothetical protein
MMDRQYLIHIMVPNDVGPRIPSFRFDSHNDSIDVLNDECDKSL